MVDGASFLMVLLVGFYLVLLSAASFFRPVLATKFLAGFASSSSAHYSELLIRMVAGLAFLQQAPKMIFSETFGLFGLVLLVTTGCLALVPWRVHERFAQKMVPFAVRFIKLFGVSSLFLGIFVLSSLLRGTAT